ncbi:hypothetical protein BELL_0042g00200 [Botrytis elliptica]|uniref:Uncharacterized protein n=1 Tax=Botrytis elliptica TaxID=278938 RepID=A0A4Z1K6K8_9HELO|nr:hypothetical protein BELL_0042g00200 [Botrytis elliptica]
MRLDKDHIERSYLLLVVYSIVCRSTRPRSYVHKAKVSVELNYSTTSCSRMRRTPTKAEFERTSEKELSTLLKILNGGNPPKLVAKLWVWLEIHGHSN